MEHPIAVIEHVQLRYSHMNFVKAGALPVLVAVGLLLSYNASVHVVSAAPVPSFIVNSQAARIIGDTVENVDGEKLGKVKDFLIELPSGRVDYVIISSGGFMGIESRQKIVPAGFFSIGTAKKRTAFVDINILRWKEAPIFKREQLAQFINPKRQQELAQFYARSGSTAPRTGENIAILSNPTGRTRPPQPITLETTADLIGKKVLGAQQEKLGHISDLLIDLENQKPTFAIISTQHLLRKDEAFAVPLRSLRGFFGTRFVANITPAALQQARGFDATIWAAPDLNQVYRYVLQDADNTAANASDRRSANLTATDQSESERDVQITRRLRQAVVKDKALTLTAKNVKIITINGRVTLRGPVKLAFEKNRIQQKAELIAGAGHVDNQLEVEANP